MNFDAEFENVGIILPTHIQECSFCLNFSNTFRVYKNISLGRHIYVSICKICLDSFKGFIANKLDCFVCDQQKELLFRPRRNFYVVKNDVRAICLDCHYNLGIFIKKLEENMEFI